ncbi:hypothetical protein B0H19DRAFT_1083986 [Mycena capillaripes]|nr:hypothetical protein B0H19DRAFT_1083986 [Mycena capillaripes]
MFAGLRVARIHDRGHLDLSASIAFLRTLTQLRPVDLKAPGGYHLDHEIIFDMAHSWGNMEELVAWRAAACCMHNPVSRSFRSTLPSASTTQHYFGRDESTRGRSRRYLCTVVREVGAPQISSLRVCRAGASSTAGRRLHFSYGYSSLVNATSKRQTLSFVAVRMIIELRPGTVVTVAVSQALRW